MSGFRLVKVTKWVYLFAGVSLSLSSDLRWVRFSDWEYTTFPTTGFIVCQRRVAWVLVILAIWIFSEGVFSAASWVRDRTWPPNGRFLGGTKRTSEARRLRVSASMGMVGNRW